jgi:hypothetical protein
VPFLSLGAASLPRLETCLGRTYQVPGTESVVLLRRHLLSEVWRKAGDERTTCNVFLVVTRGIHEARTTCLLGKIRAAHLALDAKGIL